MTDQLLSPKLGHSVIVVKHAVTSIKDAFAEVLSQRPVPANENATSYVAALDKAEFSFLHTLGLPAHSVMDNNLVEAFRAEVTIPLRPFTISVKRDSVLLWLRIQ